MYTDTNFFILPIETGDFDEDIKHNLDYFDTFDYSGNNIYKIPLLNKK